MLIGAWARRWLERHVRVELEELFGSGDSDSRLPGLHWGDGMGHGHMGDADGAAAGEASVAWGWALRG